MPLSRNCKIVKGYRSNDIALFVKIKNQVTEDREHVNIVMSEIDEASENGSMNGSFPSNRFDILPFTFQYPQFHASIKKEELGDSESKIRMFPVFLDGTTATASPTAMDFDDGDVCFDYYSKTVTNTTDFV